MNLIASLCQPEYPYLYMVNYREDTITDCTGPEVPQEHVQNTVTLVKPQENTIDLPIPTVPPNMAAHPLDSQPLQGIDMESERMEVQQDPATNTPISQAESQLDQAARSAALERPQYKDIATSTARSFISCTVGEACAGTATLEERLSEFDVGSCSHKNDSGIKTKS